MKTIRHAVILMAFAVALFSGCTAAAPPPNVSPNVQLEGQVAIKARQVIQAADMMLSAVDVLTEARLTAAQGDPVKSEAAKADARAVIQVIQRFGTEGTRLAAVLKEMDQIRTAGERQGQVDLAREIIRGMNKLITDGTLPVGEGSTKAAVQKLFSTVADLLLQLAFVLPQRV